MAGVADRRWWVLAALAVSTVATGLDVTVLNLALPMHAVKLNASSGDLQRFAGVHTLVSAAAIAPAGLLGESEVVSALAAAFRSPSSRPGHPHPPLPGGDSSDGQ